MNTYEFWNEMDKIHDAIVSYQEKTIEFNKRFINPWINLGNVFNKEESNEAIVAHQNAIEIDPENARNWYELASTYSRSGDFDKSIQAYQKTIELGFESSELYKNLALAYAITGKHQESIPVFQKALDISESDEEKTVVWNHLGNVYRKLNNYELALQAFQKADQCESVMTKTAEGTPAMEANEEITEVDAVEVDKPSTSLPTDEPASVMDSEPSTEENEPATVENVALEDESVGTEQTDDYQEEEPVSASAMLTVDEIEESATGEPEAVAEGDETDTDFPVILEIDYSENSPEGFSEEDEVLAPVEIFQEEPKAKEADAEDEPVSESVATLEEGEAPVFEEIPQEETETEEATPEEESVSKLAAALKEDQAPVFLEALQEKPVAEETAPEGESVANVVASEEKVEKPISEETVSEEPLTEESTPEEEPVAEFVTAVEEDEEPVSKEIAQEETEIEEATSEEELVTEFIAALERDEEPVSEEIAQEEPVIDEVAFTEEEPVAEVEPTMEDKQASILVQEAEDGVEENAKGPITASSLSAYEEYLEDNSEPVNVNLPESQSEETQTIVMAPTEVEVTSSEVNMEVSTDLTAEVDTKNAHVWNELGNVYFNAGSYDDAIAAYSKAIELDEQFAWPYTNLALSYVQKERLADAILLYQRGIELFSDEKDKAIAWNRLGNVYRRMNDYENAIAAYQNADELDPGNIAVTQQSRFSLLGNDNVNQEVRYSV